MCNDCKKYRNPGNIIGRILNRLGNITSLNDYIEYLKIKKNLRMTSEELKQFQDDRLRKIIRHSYETVPYYKKLFDGHDITPEDIKSVDDLAKIPITEKRTFQNADNREFLSTCFGQKDLTLTTTGGSTGTPLKIYMSKKGLRRRLAEGRRILFLHGFSAFDKSLLFSFYSYPEELIGLLGLFRQKHVPWEISIAEQYKIFREYDADGIRGYPSRVNLLAEYILDNNLDVKKPRTILISAEFLDDDVRKRIEKVFGAKVTNTYACEEYGQAAWECRMHDGLHVNSDSLVIQIIKNGKEASPGEEGEVICTDLNNYAMPLIRYNLGDIAAMSGRKCPCGISFPLIENLKGRASDYFVLPSGNKFSSTFIYILPRLGGVLEYQIAQKSLTRLDVKIVKSRDWTPEHTKKIWNFLNKCSTLKDIRISYVKSIKRTKRAKLRRFIPLKNSKKV
ncbi:phenylacetate--CoA ligase family protein [Candidatus Woesearchaeota archaeon]|nr:phenylacetate--CoA ligase family protein [Candidatus Woesearchaeota archaeon]